MLSDSSSTSHQFPCVLCVPSSSQYLERAYQRANQILACAYCSHQRHPTSARGRIEATVPTSVPPRVQYRHRDESPPSFTYSRAAANHQIDSHFRSFCLLFLFIRLYSLGSSLLCCFNTTILTFSSSLILKCDSCNAPYSLFFLPVRDCAAPDFCAIFSLP